MTPQSSLPEKLSEEIIHYIMENDLRPGDKLPNELALSKLFNAGRSTVREAMKSLSSRNIVDIRRGAGTFVSPRPGVADDPLGFTFVKDKLQLAHDLLEIRFLLEPQIAAMAALNATKEDHLALSRLCDEIEVLIRQGKSHCQKDTEYHTRIAMSSKNLVVPNLIPIINSSIEIFIDVTNSSLLQETITTHREILDAICAGQPQMAHDAMYLHLVYNRRHIEKRAG